MKYKPSDIWKIMEKEGISSVDFVSSDRVCDPKFFDVDFSRSKGYCKRSEEKLRDYAEHVLTFFQKLVEEAGFEGWEEISVSLSFDLEKREAVFSISAPDEGDVDLLKEVDLSKDLADLDSALVHGITAGDVLSALEANRIATVEARFSGGGDEGEVECPSFLNREGEEVSADPHLEGMTMDFLQLLLEDEYDGFDGGFYVSGAVLLDVAERKAGISSTYEDTDNYVERHSADLSDMFAEGKTQ